MFKIEDLKSESQVFSVEKPKSKIDVQAEKIYKVEIEVGGKIYLRHAIKTRFIKQGDNYLKIFEEYVAPIYQKGDIIASSEKIIALCQNRVIRREDIKIGFWARFLSKFACQKNRGGYGVAKAIDFNSRKE